MTLRALTSPTAIFWRAVRAIDSVAWMCGGYFHWSLLDNF